MILCFHFLSHARRFLLHVLILFFFFFKFISTQSPSDENSTWFVYRTAPTTGANSDGVYNARPAARISLRRNFNDQIELRCRRHRHRLLDRAGKQVTRTRSRLFEILSASDRQTRTRIIVIVTLFYDDSPPPTARL